MSHSMNTVVVTPDVKRFVVAVREHLTDLTEEEREELVGGLEGDLSDLVAERGVEALPEPAAYARELRVAAGFEAEGQVSSDHTVRDRTAAWLDRSSAMWEHWVRTGDHLGIPAFLTAMRAVWWVLRGLCAAALVCEIWGRQEMFGFTPLRGLVAGVCVLGSIVLGRWWPDSRPRRSVVARLLLVALNLFAFIVLPLMIMRFFVADGPEYAVADATVKPTPTLAFNGQSVHNVFVYDAQGRPVVGAQLVDEQGQRLAVPESYRDARSKVYVFPWVNGRTTLFSVFPLAEQRVDPVTGVRVGTPAVPKAPYATLPPVSRSGVTSGTGDR